MIICGLIAEYNPFHNGHLYQLNEIKRRLNPDILILLLTGNFTMRGDISTINKFDKVNLALDNNIDLIIEFPIIYSMQSADYFCSNAINILKEFKITHLAFGSESNDINILLRQIDHLKSDEYNKKVKNFLKQGNSYAKSSKNALLDIIDSNDMLGILYLKELLKNNIKPYPIKRIYNKYLDNTLNESIYQSATIIRTLNNISEYVPKQINNYYNQNGFNNFEFFFELVKYKVISSFNDLSQIHLVKEGIENLIYKNIKNNYSTFIELTCNKRYTKSYVNRILINILLDYKKNVFDNKKITYIRLLGSNKNGIAYLNKIKKEFNVPFYSKIRKGKNDILDFEIKSSEIFNLKSNVKYNEFNFPIIKT